MTDQALKNKIMRRVQITWFIKRSKPILFLQLPLIVLFLAIAHEYVAFKSVAKNSLISFGSFHSVVDYAVSAFQSAEPLIAFLASAIVLFVALALQSIVRNFLAISNKKTIVLPIKIDK